MFSRISMLPSGTSLFKARGRAASGRRMRRWIDAALRPWDPTVREPWLRHLARLSARREVALTFISSVFATFADAGEAVLRETWPADPAGPDPTGAVEVFRKRLEAERIGFLSVLCREVNGRRTAREDELQRQISGRLRRLRSAVSLNDDVTGEIDEHQVVRTMAHHISEVFAPDLLVVHLLQPQRIVDTPIALRRGQAVSLEDDERMCRLRQEPELCRTCRTGQVFRVDEAADSLIGCPHQAWPQERGGYCCVPLAGGTEVLGWMHLRRDDGGFEDEEIDVLGIYGQMVGTAMSSLRLVSENRRQATTDPLTGVHNRRHFEEVLRKEQALLRRRGGCDALIMLDVDGFKQFNDQHGHDAGDRVLTAFAQALDACCRQTDEISRLGGDEFAVLLRDCDDDHAGDVAAKIIRTAADTNVRVSATQWEHLQISAGVACCPRHAASLEDALLLADVALIRAKESGKNRHQVFNPEADAAALNDRGFQQGLRLSR